MEVSANIFFCQILSPSIHTSIPDLETDDGVAIGVDHPLGHKTSTNGRGCLSRIELALAVAHDERRLPDALSAEDDDLGLEGRHGVVDGPGVVARMGVEVLFEYVCDVMSSTFRRQSFNVGRVNRVDGAFWTRWLGCSCGIG